MDWVQCVSINGWGRGSVGQLLKLAIGTWDIISLVGKEPELLCLRVNRCWLDIIRAHLTTWFELWN